MEEHQSKPLKNIANLLGRPVTGRKVVSKNDELVPVSPFELCKFGKTSSVILCSKMDGEGTSVEVQSVKFDSVGAGNDCDNLGLSQIYVPKNEDTLLDVDSSENVTSRNMPADVGSTTMQVSAQNMGIQYKFEDNAPTSLNNATFETDSSLGKTMHEMIHITAVVQTKDKNESRDSEADRTRTICLMPTSSLINTSQEEFSSNSVLELDHSGLSDNVTSLNMPADGESSMIQVSTENMGIQHKLEDDAPTTLNNTTFETDSSLGKTMHEMIHITAVVQTKDKNENRDSEADRMRTICEMPTSSQINTSQEEFSSNSVFELDHSGLPDNVTSLNMPADAGSSTIQVSTQNMGIQHKLEDNTPTSLNKATFEKDSSVGKTMHKKIHITAVVQTKDNNENCDSETDRMRTICVMPTSSLINTSREEFSSNSVLELDHSGLSDEEVEKSLLADGVSEPNTLHVQLKTDSSLKISSSCEMEVKDSSLKISSSCKMEVNFCENAQEVIEQVSEEQTEIITSTVLTSGPDKDVNILEDSNVLNTEDNVEFVLSNPDSKVESVKLLVEVDYCFNYNTTEVVLKNQLSYDSAHDKNEITCSQVSCPSTVTDIENEVLPLDCPGHKLVECDSKEENKNMVLPVNEEVIYLKHHDKLSDEQNLNTNGEKESILSSKIDHPEDTEEIIILSEFKSPVLENKKDHDETISDVLINRNLITIPTGKEPSPNLPCDWARKLKSSTPCQKFSDTAPEDDVSDIRVCQILSTPKGKKNVNLEVTRGKKIDFAENVKDQNKDCFVEILEDFSVNHLENTSANKEIKNFPVLKKELVLQENSLKITETCTNSKSMQIKRPASPEIEEIKKAKCNDSNKKRIVEVDLTDDEIESEIRKRSNDKNSQKGGFTNFVSDDPKENDDNNNPEWEVLKKLETDDERYKAVRKRWRNLVIPDPNKNLTCIHVRSSFKHPGLCGRVGARKNDNATSSRKRTHSHEPTTSTEHVPMKRARTRSCTTSYELKVQNCNKKMEEESFKLSQEKRNVLANTSDYYNKQRSYLMASNLRYYNNWEFQTRIAFLSAAEKRAQEAVHQDFSGAFNRLNNEKQRQTVVFKKAMKEVEAFHKFYRKLEDTSKTDCFFLTDVELDDVMATDKLYETFNTFYS